MSNLCNNCGSLIDCNNKTHFLCSFFKVKREVKKRGVIVKTFFKLVRKARFQQVSRELKMDERGRPLKCTKCLEFEARLKELNKGEIRCLPDH